MDYADLDSVKARLGITDTDDDDLLTDYITRVNEMIDAEIECPIGPSELTELVLDGYSARAGGRMFYVRIGIQTLTKVEIASGTGQTFTEIDSDRYFLRPLEMDRLPGWPAQEVWLADWPGWTYKAYPLGYNNVRLTGTFGFASIPTQLLQVAENLVIRSWMSRRVGQVDLMGVDESNQPLVSQYLSAQDRAILAQYKYGTRNWFAPNVRRP